MQKTTPRQEVWKFIRDMILLSFFWGCWYYHHHHHLPSAELWFMALATWYAMFLVKSGYKRIVGELERQNVLLVKILERLES